MDATQIILIVFIVLLIVIYPIMMYSKNKKENQRMQEQTNSLKRGDKILTTSGIYGTIVDLHLQDDKKVVTIETGTDKYKGYLSIDAYAIFQIFRDEPVEEPKTDKKVEDKNTKNELPESSSEVVKEQNPEATAEEIDNEEVVIEEELDSSDDEAEN